VVEGLVSDFIKCCAVCLTDLKPGAVEDVCEFCLNREIGAYATLGLEIGRLVQEKQAAYGDSFGKAGDVMRILYPNGIPPEKMDDALCIVRILDKVFRIATDKDALGESPYKDIVGYGLLGAARSKKGA
jgi:hypothetical protein